VLDRAFMQIRTAALAVVGLAGLLCTFVGAEGEARADEGPQEAKGGRSLQEYRWFRALSIDLVGRIPTRAEVAAFEAPDFNVDQWIDKQLEGPGYAERLQRIYMDAMRLDLGETFKYIQSSHVLRRFPVDVAMPDGTTKKTWVYWRNNQRRATTELDRTFCFGAANTGQTYNRTQIPTPELPTKAVPLATMMERAAKVKPWWLYRDYKAATPTNHYRAWSLNEPRFRLGETTDRKGAALRANDPRLLVDFDGTEVDDVWVCKEETQTAVNAAVKIRNVTTNVACNTDLGLNFATTCGCGKGLENCTPGAFGNDPNSMVVATLAPLGPEANRVLESSRQEQSAWFRRMWHEEARHFIGSIFAEDRDFRDVLTARYDWVNGPLAQFYKGIVNGDCCSDQVGLGATPGAFAKPDPLFDPSKIPADLNPTQMDRWVKVEDRGPHAAGVLTLPAFLMKFASRRGRANAVYNTFLCREFIAENLDLQPSEEANLTIRPGCSTCHAKLEPLAAYFTRTKENSLTFLTAPIDNPICAKKTGGPALDPACNRYYDPSFATADAGKLRGAYASAENAEKGPAGFAQAVTSSPEFATCAARTVLESMLGRKTQTEDQMVSELDHVFTDGGFKMRPLVRAIVKSNAYRNANAVAVIGIPGGAK
jgi:hypothetical protein